MDLNYWLYRAKYKYGKYLPLTKPVDVSLELASECSMRCNYCYFSDREHLPFKTKFMELDVAKKIIKDAAEVGVHSIKLNFRGESTLNPHYREIACYTKELAKGTVFIDRLANSNFKIPKALREDKFIGLSALTKVKISYDSFIPEVFAAQRAGGNHELTTENIGLFYNHPERIKSETQIVIQAVRTNLNKNEDIVSECKKRWPEVEVSIRDMVAGRVDNDKVKELENKKRDLSNRQPCTQAFVRLIYTSNGNVLPCCPNINESLSIGNSNEQSVKEIFNSKKAKKLRQDLKSGIAFEQRDACKNCSSFESYKGWKPLWNS